MAIQMRRGNSADFNPSKMLPGEWAVSQDNQKLYMCFSPGNVVEIGTSAVIELFVQQAEAWAVGERDGQPVTVGDETYHNNSKYYSEQADTSSQTASSASTIAVNKSLDSEAWAVGQRAGSDVPSTDDTYENNSKYYAGEAKTDKEAADVDALKAEGYANGNQNGTPVSSGEYYQNNSKYYAEQAESYKDQAAAIVGIGIATTSTPGIVKPDGSSITVDPDGTIHGGSQIQITGKKVIVS